MEQILSFNADNALPNDKQTTWLAELPNSFEEANHVWCFNHTLQLSTRALLHLFNVGLRKALEVLGADEDQDDDTMSVCDDDDVEGDDEDEDRLVVEEVDDPDDNINELDALAEED